MILNITLNMGKRLLLYGALLLTGVVVVSLVVSQVKNRQSSATTQPVNPTKTQVSTESSPSATAVKEVVIEGSNFKFVPDTFTVKSGETVKITFKNVQGMHDFVVDSLNIKTPVIQTNQDATVEFVATAPGTYEFYCSIDTHRQIGMKGTLVIE